jgi:hypothetical protein
VAAVLKAFFRELPEPLLGFETYGKIQQIAEKKESMDKGSGSSGTKAHFRELVIDLFFFFCTQQMMCQELSVLCVLLQPLFLLPTELS